MSEIQLNILDFNRAIYGTIHASEADAAVAALSAEPETIAELQQAMARFIKPVDDSSPFALFYAGTNSRPWDAGIIFIDLAARIVAVESTYSMPSAEGQIDYHDGHTIIDVCLPYRVPEDWLFVDSVAEYEDIRDRRRAEFSAKKPVDARSVLYDAMLEFIARECLSAREERAEDPIVKIHAQWLMTPRADLCGQSPREVLLAKRNFIDADLQSRELQWSFLGEPAPCLKVDSAAYRFAGFGTHEGVLYYELMRLLLVECWTLVRKEGSVPMADEVARLGRIKKDWLECPQPDFGGRNPAFILECERRRLPLIASPEEILGDENCPCCQAMAEEDTPTFWHLDGCNMDSEFPFSFFRTRAEWEENERSFKQLTDEFKKKNGDAPRFSLKE